MDERQAYTTFAILILALLLLTRLPAMAEYFTIDNVNLAFSLDPIAAVQNLTGGKYVFYSDITPDSPPFTIDGVQIIPKL
jgi:hypothetical protein